MTVLQRRGRDPGKGMQRAVVSRDDQRAAEMSEEKMLGAVECSKLVPEGALCWQKL